MGVTLDWGRVGVEIKSVGTDGDGRKFCPCAGL